MMLEDTVFMLGVLGTAGALILGLHRTVTPVVPGPSRENPSCTGCGYDLLGLDERATCPECGLRDPRLRMNRLSVRVE